jgi:hypothetical protein
MISDDRPDYVTATELADCGISVEDVRRRCPHAVEYALDDSSFWRREDLAPLLGDRGEDGKP